MDRIKKKLSIVLLFCFLLTLALSNISFAAASSFTDVTDSHWAKQQLTRMNLRGIIKGYEDGTARPNQSVTQLEAIIMAVRIMGLDDQTATVTAGDYLPVTVPSWQGARETAVVAYKAGLIDSSDFTHDQTASREWIAKLLVKILQQDSMVNSVTGEYISFTDASKIGSKYLNYVKAAYKLGLIGGYTDGTFKPQNKVTRAEMAAFLSRCEDQMNIVSTNVTLGTINKIDGINLELKSLSGQTVNVYVLPNSSMLYNKDGKKISLSDLQINDAVYAIHTGSPLNYLEVRDASSFDNITNSTTKPMVINVEGTITRILTDRKAVVVAEENNKLTTVLVDNNTKITRNNDGASTTLEFSSLRINDEVKIASENQIATEIIVSNESDEYTQGGTIYDVDVYSRVIIMEESDGLKTYKMSADMEVSIAGMLSATASNLKTGDKASYEIRNNMMIAIAVGSSSELYDGKGTIMEINTASRFITYRTSNGDLKADYYNNNTTVSFNGERGRVTDLQPNDVATIVVNNNIIASIDVDNRTLTEGHKGTVVAVDTSARTLIIRDNDGVLQEYKVENNAIISLEEETLTNLSAIKKDMIIEYTLNNGNINSIKTNNRIKGTVTRINTNNYTIEILPEDARNTVSYTVSNNVYVNVKDRSGTRLKLVNEGDEVEIKIVSDRVTQIDVATRIDCSIYSTYSNSSTRIFVENTNGYKQDIYIYSDVDLIIPGNNRPRVRDLQVGDKLILTYMGNNLVSVEVTSQIAGTIEGLNPTSKVVTVRGYDGKQYRFNFDATSYVNRDGLIYNDFSKLAIGDKIAVTDSADDGRCFALLQSKTARVGRFYTDKTRLFLQNSTIVGDWSSYTLSSNVYLHKGNQRLTPSDFPADTNVTVYFVDNMIYEVIKL